MALHKAGIVLHHESQFVLKIVCIVKHEILGKKRKTGENRDPEPKAWIE
jgi:hypothetical protein